MTFKSSHGPEGNMADVPKSTLIFQFGSIFGPIREMYVPATPANFPSPRWETYVWILVCREAVLVSILARSRSPRPLSPGTQQGAECVLIFESFPSPPRETHVWFVVCRALVSLSRPAQSQSSTPKFIPIKLIISSCVLMLKSSHRPDRKVADTLCLDSRLHYCGRLFDQLQSVRAAET